MTTGVKHCFRDGLCEKGPVWNPDDIDCMCTCDDCLGKGESYLFNDRTYDEAFPEQRRVAT